MVSRSGQRRATATLRRHSCVGTVPYDAVYQPVRAYACTTDATHTSILAHHLRVSQALRVETWSLSPWFPTPLFFVALTLSAR